MRAIAIKSFACGLAAGTLLALGMPVHAEQELAVTTRPLAPPHLEEPANVDSCLSLLERVIEHALAADMLDDQIEKSEAELERMETACYDKRFIEALDAAKTVALIVAANK